MNITELKMVVKKLDLRRKTDLAASLVDAVFDISFEYDIDKLEYMVELIESITGIDGLSELLYE